LTRHLLRLAAAPVLLALSAGLIAVGSTGKDAPADSAEGPDRDRLAAAYFALPLSFEANPGRYDFASRGAGYSLLVSASEAALGLATDDGGQAGLRMRLMGADPRAQAGGLEKLTGKVNYFVGEDRRRWRTGIETYRRVGFDDVYDGVDVAYYGNQHRLEYDFEVSPGADPAQIELRFTGTNEIEVTDRGDLVLRTAAGVVRQLAPIAYQRDKDTRSKVDSRYVLDGEDTVRFALGEYDPRRELVIDPVLEYSTYLGGGDQEFADDIAVDSTGHAYVVGRTSSSGIGGSAPVFPTTTGALDTSYNGNVDAFVTKFNPSGSQLVYSTFLGAGQEDIGEGIAVDSSDNAYITGRTTSSTFPTFGTGADATYGGSRDAFVTKLNPAGSALVYSTFLGGAQEDFGEDVAVDGSGSAYVSGTTKSESTVAASDRFPTTTNAFDTSFAGGFEAFMSKYNAGPTLAYSTYLGNTGDDFGEGIAVDASGNAYVTGITKSQSPSFPTTAGAFDTSHAGGEEVFVTKINPSPSTPLVYSTFLGGGGDDGGKDVAVDASGNAYVTGYASPSGFPTTAGSFDTSHNGNKDGFVTKLNPAGTAPLVYSGFLGHGSDDFGEGIALDSLGNAYVTGRTLSSSFPTTPGTFDTSYNNNGDAFLTRVNTAGSALADSTFLGGGGNDLGEGIAVDSLGCPYVTGQTFSTNYPTTQGAFDTTYITSDDGDAFVTKFCDGATKTGTKFEDLDGDGVRDTGEPGLPGWTIRAYRDTNNDDQLSTNETSVAASAVTDSSGNYSLSLSPGHYVVCEVLQTDWSQTAPSNTKCQNGVADLGPGGHDESLISGQSVSGNDFGNFELATTAGTKWHDHDGDGTRDQDDEGLSGWRIYVDLDDDGVYDDGSGSDPAEPSDLTDSNGAYLITGIPAGSYKVREVLQSGWSCTSPDPCHHQESFASGSEPGGNDFGNFELAQKSGTKFEDQDGDGARDPGEPGLSGWQIYVDYNDNSSRDQGEPDATTGQDGSYTISGIDAGDYKVRETQQSGWNCTHPSPNCFHQETFASGDHHQGNDFGNRRTPAPEGGGQPPPTQPEGEVQPEREVGQERAQSEPEADRGDVGEETERSRRRRSRDLPFTGVVLAGLALAGLLLTAGGVALRRRARSRDE
jgi:hypothetical protein